MSNNLQGLETKSKQTVDHFKTDLSKMRTGRASGGMLEGINVDYYGSSVPLKQLGLINTPEPRLITIQVYDAGAVDAIDKAIQQSELGLNPSRDGNLLRINVPALTEERRKDLIKKMHKMAEEARVALRNHRRDVIDELKRAQKAKELSEDDLRRGQESVQKVTDRFILQVDQALTAKEKELLEV